MNEQGEPSEEQLREALRKLHVEDVLLQTVVTLVNLAGRRLTMEDEKDLEQARVGIEAVRALLPLCPQDQAQPIKDALAQLQMIYVRETREPGAEQPAPPAGEQKPPPTKEDDERAKARAKIWTPPGT